MHELKIQYVSPDKVIPYENNPRDNAPAVDPVKSSIADFDFTNPILVDKNMVIIGGHTRLMAAKRLGLTKVPVICLDYLTPEQVQKLRLVDNKTAELAGWDMAKLKVELQNIGEDLSQFGFEDIDEYLEPDLIEDDFDLAEIEDAEDTIVQAGELWKLGRHRLLCGDATNAKDIQRLTDGNLVDLYLTDPPYNVDYEGGTGLKIQNDNMSDEKFLAFLTDAFAVAKESLKDGGSFYIWHGDFKRYEFIQALRNVGMFERQVIVWVKNTIVLGRQDYQWMHEPCLYGWKDGAGHYFTQDRTLRTVYEDKPNYSKMSKAELIERIKLLEEPEVPTTIIREDKPLANAIHPTMKPVKLIGKLIHNSTKKDEKVLDTFGGSGTTLIASEQLGRSCYMSELDPKYCDAIIKRWEEFTGEKAERLDA